MKYTTSLRPWVSRRLEEIGKVDLLVGIPCYNNQSTIAHVMDRYHDYWLETGPSEPVPGSGEPSSIEPEPFSIDTGRMIRIYKEGFEHFGVFWEKVLRPENFLCLKSLYDSNDGDFCLPTEVWAKVVYDFSATFHAWERHRRQLVDTMSPLYYARVASFVNKTKNLTNVEAEQFIEDQARQFEALKPYLIEGWSRERTDLNRSGDHEIL